MAHPTTVPASIPLPTWDNGQQRLSAAIALFRSEASASGYVVEEVRLRLPVPDVDVMPRVVIAQQSAASNTPPPYPPPKYHKPLNRPNVPGERQKVQIDMPPKKMPRSPPFGLRSHPMPLASEHKVMGPLPKSNGTGFKRTVSGSVIVRQQSPGQGGSFGKVSNSMQPFLKTEVSERKQSLKLVEAVSKEKLKAQEVDEDEGDDPDEDENDSPNKEGKFWNTGFGAEKRAALFKAAESMETLRKGALMSRKLNQVRDEEEDRAMQSEDSDSEHISPLKNRLLRRKNDDEEAGENDQHRSSQSIGQSRMDTEKTIKYNGHNIPESHVQLLLSSVATISAREQSGSDKESSRSTEESNERDNGEEKGVIASSIPLTSPNISDDAIMPRADRLLSRPGKTNGRGRRDSSERGRTSSALRPFKCHKCPSSFDRDGHLKVHILAVHEKKRPFVCQVCDASFGHSSSLLRHVRTVHQASPAVGSGRVGQIVKNNVVGTVAGTERAARRSVEEGWEEVQDGGEKHFRCSVCSLAFSRVALLNRHVANKHPVHPAVGSSEEGETDRKESP